MPKVYRAEILWISDIFRIYTYATASTSGTLQNISRLQQAVSLAGFTSPNADRDGMDLCTQTWVPKEPHKRPVTFPANPKTKTPHTEINLGKDDERLSPALNTTEQTSPYNNIMKL